MPFSDCHQIERGGKYLHACDMLNEDDISLRSSPRMGISDFNAVPDPSLVLSSCRGGSNRWKYGVGADDTAQERWTLPQ